MRNKARFRCTSNGLLLDVSGIAHGFPLRYNGVEVEVTGTADDVQGYIGGILQLVFRL